MYDHTLMHYYEKSDNRAKVPHPNIVSKKYNPSCGDEVSFTGLIKDGRITDLKYEGAGCIISQGSASFLCEYARGKLPGGLLALTLDDMLSMLQLKLGPNRMQCVQLALDALQEVLKAHTTHA